MGRTHTRRTHTGLVNWGIGGLNQGAGQGPGVVWEAGTCQSCGGMEGKMMICGLDCGDHPTTLTASWWAGYSGREGGAGRGEQRAEPRWRLEETGTQKPPKRVSQTRLPLLLDRRTQGG